MKKYFFKNDAGQQGPFNLEELKDKGITPDTPIWHEGLDSWTTAAQVDELKELIAPPVTVQEVVEQVAAPAAEKTEAASEAVESAVADTVTEVKEEMTAPVAAASTEVPEATTIEAPVTNPVTETAAAAPVAKTVRKKGNPVITWALSLAALGGTGYYVYQDMEKNKTGASETVVTDNAGEQADTTNTVTMTDVNTSTDNTTAVETESSDADKTDTIGITTTTTKPAVTEVTDEEKTKKLAEEKKKLIAAEAKKKEEEKKKLLAAETKKKEEEKKKLLAAQALAAKEMEMRNNWVRYITIGSFKTEGDDKVKPFTIPVYNGYNVAADKVTLRVDYIKKEKIVGSETIVVSNIPAKGSATAQAAGNKKGHKANVYITGATSRQLHFCYPSTGGKAGDPYYCN